MSTVLIHGLGGGREPLIVEVDAGATVGDLKTRILEAGWPAEEAILDLAIADAEEVLALEALVGELIEDGCRVAALRCRKVRTTLIYVRAEEVELPGWWTLRRVLRFALETFKIEKAEWPDFQFTHGDPPVPVNLDDVLADLAPTGTCAVELFLGKIVDVKG